MMDVHYQISDIIAISSHPTDTLPRTKKRVRKVSADPRMSPLILLTPAACQRSNTDASETPRLPLDAPFWSASMPPTTESPDDSLTDSVESPALPRYAKPSSQTSRPTNTSNGGHTKNSTETPTTKISTETPTSNPADCSTPTSQMTKNLGIEWYSIKKTTGLRRQVALDGGAELKMSAGSVGRHRDACLVSACLPAC